MIYCNQTKTWNSCMKKCFCHLTIPQKGWSRRNTDVIIACGCFGTPMLTRIDLGTIWKTKRGVENHRNRSETGKDEAWNNTHWDFTDFDKKTSNFSNFTMIFTGHYGMQQPRIQQHRGSQATNMVDVHQLVLWCWKPGNLEEFFNAQAKINGWNTLQPLKVQEPRLQLSNIISSKSIYYSIPKCWIGVPKPKGSRATRRRCITPCRLAQWGRHDQAGRAFVSEV